MSIQDKRKHYYKSSFKAEECIQKRVQNHTQIRKQKITEVLFKRRNIDFNNDSAVVEMDLDYREIREYLFSSDYQQQHHAAVKIRTILSSKEINPPVELLAIPNFLTRLLQLLKSPNDILQYEIAWSITNIASGSIENTREIVNNRGIENICEILSSETTEKVKEQAIWALGNISGDSIEFRNEILSKGAVRLLISYIQDPSNCNLSLLRTITWTLSNFCRGKPQPTFSVIQQILPWLCNILFKVEDIEVISDALWGISFISSGPNEVIELIVDCLVCRRVVELLMNKEIKIKLAALKIIGNIVAGEEDHTQLILNLGILPCLSYLLSPMNNREVCKEACWVLSNIAGGTHTQVKQVIESNIIPMIIELIAEAEFYIKLEAVWIIFNISAKGDSEDLRYIVGQGCIDPLCSILENSDVTIKSVVLNTFENIFVAGSNDPAFADFGNKYLDFFQYADGVQKLETLLNDSDESISSMALELLETYFKDQMEM